MLERTNLFPMRRDAASRQAHVTSFARLVRARVTSLVRIGLAVVFFWLGVLKLSGVGSVVEVLRNSVPLLAGSPYIEFLGLTELIIATGLVIKRLANPAAALLILHLFCMMSLAIVAPTLVFAPAFPVLTMNGEFLAKNFLLLGAGLVVISSRDR